MISFPNLDQLKKRTRSDLSQTTELDSTIRRSFLRSLADALASRSFDLNKTIQQLVGVLFPQTATGSFLRRWGNYEGLPPLEATSSSGSYTLTGNEGVSVEANTVYTSGDVILTLKDSVTLSTITNSIISLNRVGNTVTAITGSNHNLASGITTTISGADQSAYNGSFVVTVIDINTFTYQVSGAPSTPATGTILSSFVGSLGILVSSDFGSSQNLEPGAIVTLSSPLPGVNTSGRVGPNGITGGTDAEQDSAYSNRILNARANPTSLFNVGQISLEARKVNGVTRVFIKPATPLAGQVEVYFLRDGDDPINPDANEILAVKNQLLTIKPAFMNDDDLFVLSPTLVSTDFTFSDITPDTPSMRTAISNSLEVLFSESIQFETLVSEDDYRSAIKSSIDSTGASLQSFTLDTPSGDISVGTSEIASLGTVTFS